MARSLETEVRALLRAITAEGVYEPNAECQNECCRILARLQDRVSPTSKTAASNGHATRKH